jgi:serine/threonine-protein kinase RsbW
MSENGWIWSLKRCITSDSHEERELVARLLEELERQQWSDRDVFGIHLAFEEALVNAIKHGNLRDPDKCVQVDCRLSKDRIRIQITDEGSGFDPSVIPDPTVDENLEVPSGRGLMLMRCYMTSVQFNTLGNEVVMEKLRTPPEEESQSGEQEYEDEDLDLVDDAADEARWNNAWDD